MKITTEMEHYLGVADNSEKKSLIFIIKNTTDQKTP